MALSSTALLVDAVGIDPDLIKSVVYRLGAGCFDLGVAGLVRDLCVVLLPLL